MLTSASAVVWNEFGPQDHFVNFYEDDTVLLDFIDRFIGADLTLGDGGVVIATKKHLLGLEERFKARGLDVGV